MWTTSLSPGSKVGKPLHKSLQNMMSTWKKIVNTRVKPLLSVASLSKEVFSYKELSLIRHSPSTWKRNDLSQKWHKWTLTLTRDKVDLLNPLIIFKSYSSSSHLSRNSKANGYKHEYFLAKCQHGHLSSLHHLDFLCNN